MEAHKGNLERLEGWTVRQTDTSKDGGIDRHRDRMDGQRDRDRRHEVPGTKGWVEIQGTERMETEGKDKSANGSIEGQRGWEEIEGMGGGDR